MDYEEFATWLRETKSLSARSASDVVSRLRRVTIMLGSARISNTTLKKLDQAPDFLKCSVSVKSQLRRAIKLYLEFKC